MIFLKQDLSPPSRGARPAGGIAAAILLENAKEHALARWQEELALVAALTERVEAAIAVASDPSVPAARRLEAMKSAERYQGHLANAWDETREFGRSDVIRAFKDMATGLDPMGIAGTLLSLENEMKPPARTINLSKLVEQAREELMMALGPKPADDLEADLQNRHSMASAAPSF